MYLYYLSRHIKESNLIPILGLYPNLKDDFFAKGGRGGGPLYYAKHYIFSRSGFSLDDKFWYNMYTFGVSDSVLEIV